MGKNKYCNNSNLIRPSLINASLFLAAFILIISYCPNKSIWITLLAASIFYICQIILFSRFDKISFLVCVPLSIYALCFGLIQEMLFIKTGVLLHSRASIFPPLWLLSLYPLFALTLNSSLSFLSKKLALTFFLSGIFANLSYFIIGNQSNQLQISTKAYPIIFIVSGISVILLILLNRKLNLLREKYTNPKEIKKLLTVFFDKRCSFCSHQMEALQNRNQTGEVCYACPSQEEDLSKITDAFTYKEAMETIHAIDEDNKVLTGTQTISALFARTDLPWIAIFLQAPGFSYLFEFGYAISAKLRKRV